MKKISIFLIIFGNMLFSMERPDSNENLSGNFALISVKFAQALRAKNITIDLQTLDALSKDILGRATLVRSERLLARIDQAKKDLDEATTTMSNTGNSFSFMARQLSLTALQNRYSEEFFYLINAGIINDIVDRAELLAGTQQITVAHLRQAIIDLEIVTKSAKKAEEDRKAAAAKTASWCLIS